MLVMLRLCVADAATPTIKSVTVQQRYPWNNKIDITVALTVSSNDIAKTVCTFVATNTSTKAKLMVSNITQNGSDTGSGTSWIRKYVWDASSDLGSVKINDITFAVSAEIDYGGVQLWEGGPYWAECNVGASSPEDYGYYFWWGDTVGYTNNGSAWISVDGLKSSISFISSGTAASTYNKSTSTLQSSGYIDSTGNLVAKYDAATVHLGAPWRMPTYDEIGGLVDNCTTTWTTRNGVYGRLVTGKGDYASKSIFLPAAGYGYGSYLYDPGSYGLYWSSTPNSDGSNDAWYLVFGSSSFGRSYRYSRCYGRSVRPVRGFAN